MVLFIYTPEQMLTRGLKLAGMGARRQARQCEEENIEDFKSIYGTHPIVLAQIWEDLQTTTNPDARIDTKKRGVNMKNFLRANHFLARYPSERQRKVMFGNCRYTLRKWCWYFVTHIRAMKAEKVRCFRSPYCCCFVAPAPLIHPFAALYS